MAATRSVLRPRRSGWSSPGDVLARVNEHLCPDMPANMFVTCLYGVLDPATGRFRFANAGHDLPYVRTADGVGELRARGMPLGLMPGMDYEEKEATLAPGDTVLLYSDGIVEAHDPERRDVRLPAAARSRRRAARRRRADRPVLADLRRSPARRRAGGRHHDRHARRASTPPRAGARQRRRCSSSSSSRASDGNERAGDATGSPRVGRAASASTAGAPRAPRHRRRRGHDERDGARQRLPPRPAGPVRVLCEPDTVLVQVTDHGGGRPPGRTARCPTSRRSSRACSEPRGWGLFLIKNMVDEVHETRDDGRHTLELRCARTPATRDTRRCHDDDYERRTIRRATASRSSTLSGRRRAAPEARSSAACEEATADGPRGRPQLRRRRLHQLDRYRADRRAARQGPGATDPVRACGLTDHYREIFEITRLSDFMLDLPDERRAPCAVRTEEQPHDGSDGRRSTYARTGPARVVDIQATSRRRRGRLDGRLRERQPATCARSCSTSPASST